VGCPFGGGLERNVQPLLTKPIPSVSALGRVARVAAIRVSQEESHQQPGRVGTLLKRRGQVPLRHELADSRSLSGVGASFRDAPTYGFAHAAAQAHNLRHNGAPEFGPLLRVARLAAGVTLKGLSREAGVNHSHLSRFERGQVPVSLNLYSHAVVTLAHMVADKDAA
jgi:Helix-turn-helix domain